MGVCVTVKPSNLLLLDLISNKKFWEELISYIPFTVVLVSDTKSGKKRLVCMRNEGSKTVQPGRLQCWYC
jgi:hypothetical protein